MAAILRKAPPKEVKPIAGFKAGPCSLYCACVPGSKDSLNANELVVSDRQKMLNIGAGTEAPPGPDPAEVPLATHAAEAAQKAAAAAAAAAAVAASERPPEAARQQSSVREASEGVVNPWASQGLLQQDFIGRRSKEEEIAEMATGRAQQKFDALCGFISPALRAGRVAEAKRALSALQSLGLSKLVSERDIAKVQLVSSEFEASLQKELLSVDELERQAQAQGDSDWEFERFSEGQGLEALAYRYDIEDGTLYIVCEARCPELDAVKAFANVVEYDLTSAVQNVLDAEVIASVHGPVESVWHAFKAVNKPKSADGKALSPAVRRGQSSSAGSSSSSGCCASFRSLGDAVRRLCGFAPTKPTTQVPRGDVAADGAPPQPEALKRALTSQRAMPEDNLMRIMAVDALDAQAGGHGLWAAIYALGDEMTELDGMPLPAVKEGHIRNPYRRSAWLFKPFRDDRGRICPGCSMTIFFALNPFDQALMSRTAANISQFLSGFEVSAAKSTDLDDRMRISPRQKFYAEVRRHLEGRSDLHLPIVGELPRLKTSSDSSGNGDSLKPKATAHALIRPSLPPATEGQASTAPSAFEELSTTIPASWANA